MGLSKAEKEARLKFVRQWADYMKSHTNKVWSRQQTMLIDSMLKGADQSKEHYLKRKAVITRG
jgi:hypothetical protein